MQPNDLPDSPIAPGQVWLVGAGPGDPDLLTRKAERLIAAADIVFYDALVGPGVLGLIPPGVERVGVGKRSGRHSKAQESINHLLLAAAKAGRRVVEYHGDVSDADRELAVDRFQGPLNSASRRERGFAPIAPGDEAISIPGDNPELSEVRCRVRFQGSQAHPALNLAQR